MNKIFILFPIWVNKVSNKHYNYPEMLWVAFQH